MDNEKESVNRVPVILSTIDVLDEENLANLAELVKPYGDRHNIDFLFLNGIEVIRL